MRCQLLSATSRPTFLSWSRLDGPQLFSSSFFTHKCHQLQTRTSSASYCHLALSKNYVIADRTLLPNNSFSTGAMASAYSTYHGASSKSQHSLTALGRWSGIEKQLPDVNNIKALHIYDFDNTLFKTPLPNQALWTGQTIGLLSNQDKFINGGWWHDNRILASTGQGLEKEEPRAWEGWWNEKIVQLVRLSMKQPDAICVLLTGRSEHRFTELVKRMVVSKGLDFDLLTLKPAVGPANQRFENTMHFKQIFLRDLMETYSAANEIRVYEDRPKHTKGFRDFFEDFNYTQATLPTRGSISAEVIQVADSSTTLEPVVEIAEVQRMIDKHNEALLKQPLHLRPNRLMIKKTVFFTSYVIGAEDSKRLISLANIPDNVPAHALKFHGNNIVICPRPCPQSILDKVGGIGAPMKWEVTGTACYRNMIWAACLAPVPANAAFHSDNPVPLVVLALKKGARPIDAGKINTWSALPQDQRFIFDSSVGEKMILRIEGEDPREDEYESLFANKTAKRKLDQETTANQPQTARQNNPIPAASNGGAPGVKGAPTQPRNRGNGAKFRGRGGGRGGRGRGGGGYHHYRSLDDVQPTPQIAYGESQPPTGPSNGGKRFIAPGAPNSTTDLQDYY